MPAIEPYRDEDLPGRFLNWIETVRDILRPIPQFLELAGTPEGVITAEKGTRYFRTDGPPFLYYKSTDGGNTGWLEEAVADTKYKLADTVRNNTAALADDDHLVGWILKAASQYKFEGLLRMDSADATPDMKMTFQVSNLPVHAPIRYHSILTSGVVGSMDVVDAGSDFVLELDATDRYTHLIGFIITHATLDATLDFQFAQNGAHASDTTLYRGSWITFTRIGPST